MLLTSSIQGIGNTIFPLVGLFLTMALSLAMTLVCEKRVTPLKAIQYSFMAAIYLVILIMMFISMATAGLGLLWTLPFFFNVKAIIYRNMFGITLQVMTIEGDNKDSTPPSSSPENGSTSSQGNTFDA